MKKTFIVTSLMLVVAIIISSTITVFAVVGNSNISDIAPSPGSVSKITERLMEQFDGNGSMIDINMKVPVMIWFKDIDLTDAYEAAVNSVNMTVVEWESYISGDNVTHAVVQQYINNKRAQSAALYQTYNNANVAEYLSDSDIIYISMYSPVVLANLTSIEVTELAQENDVLMLDYYYEDDEEEISNVLDATKVSDVQDIAIHGYTGEGITIGVFEANPPSASFPNIPSNTNIYSVDNSESTDHADFVIEIIRNIAPDADYYVALASSTLNINNMQAIEWLVSRGANIINASRKIGQDGCDHYISITPWLEHIVYAHDVIFVKSSGNLDDKVTGVTSGGMARNVITVGNVNYNGTSTNYSDDYLANTSAYYSGSALASKPDICAYGNRVYSQFLGKWSVGSGTSFSAPLVSGTIALLCEQDPSLLVAPDTVKAILTASVNSSSPYRYVPSNRSATGNNYMKYGAGILDALNACNVVENAHYITGTISTTASSKTHNISITDTTEDVRISLACLVTAWVTLTDPDDLSTGILTSKSLANLDLKVYTPNSSTPIAVSMTKNNNVEIVQFTPTVSGTYRIEVVQTTPSNHATSYGIAWYQD